MNDGVASSPKPAPDRGATLQERPQDEEDSFRPPRGCDGCGWFSSDGSAGQARDGAVAAGVLGGLVGGAIIGGAIANSRPAYAEPGPAYVVEEPPCHMVRESSGMDTTGVPPHPGLRLIRTS